MNATRIPIRMAPRTERFERCHQQERGYRDPHLRRIQIAELHERRGIGGDDARRLQADERQEESDPD
jgi:hypothetical protein